MRKRIAKKIYKSIWFVNVICSETFIDLGVSPLSKYSYSQMMMANKKLRTGEYLAGNIII